MPQTLFDKYGVIPIVTKISHEFCKCVLRHPNLGQYFANVGSAQLSIHQAAFVALAIGRMPTHYAGRCIGKSHTGLGISDTSFDMVIEILQSRLRSFDIEGDGLISIINTIRRYRSDIGNRCKPGRQKPRNVTDSHYVFSCNIAKI